VNLLEEQLGTSVSIQNILFATDSLKFREAAALPRRQLPATAAWCMWRGCRVLSASGSAGSGGDEVDYEDAPGQRRRRCSGRRPAEGISSHPTCGTEDPARCWEKSSTTKRRSGGG
jgi:hypothetical protein